MSRAKGKPVADKAARGLKMLDGGGFAQGWIAREYLSLDARPEWGDIAAAVHKEIHAAARETDPKRAARKVIRGIMAGASALREMLKK